MGKSFRALRLSRKHSMTRRSDFQRVRKAGRAKVGEKLILSTLEDSSLPGLMVGFITTRKVGKAHERNLLRRRLRAITSQNAGGFLEKRRFLIAIPRRGATEATFQELEEEWLQLAHRLRLFAKPDSPKGGPQ